MMRITIGKALTLGLLIGVAGFGAAVAACSSSSSSGSSGSNVNGPGGGVSTQPASCANATHDIHFSPMYSAFIPGSAAHSFQIPAVVDGVSGTTWGASDPSKVKMAPDPTTGGVMITVLAAGDVDIIATAGDGSCGKSTLHVTSATENDWQIGNARYNDGNSLHFGPGRGDAGQATPDAGPACTNCHGPTATNGIFNDVSHTPEQTGGFSDDDLINIVVNGVVPDGGYFDPNVIIPDAGSDPALAARAYSIWQRFHKWSDITPDQAKGMVVYLRSITPAPQDGTSNFGGRRDGGRGDGGRHRDGGFEGGPGPGQDGGGSDAAGD